MFAEHKPFNVRVEYEPAVIRHIAAQCPSCQRWFHGDDISDTSITYAYEIDRTHFCCPVCNKEFGFKTDCDDVQISESFYPAIYDGCLEKKISWE